jgi:hypothetical protein
MQSLKNEDDDEVSDSVDGEVTNKLTGIDLSDDESGVWSDTDRSVVLACLGLVKTAKAAINKTSKAISSSGQCGTQESVMQLDAFMEQVAAVSPAVDDLVTSLYPPVKQTDVQQNVCLLYLFI